MPVFSSGQSAVQVPDTWAALRSLDLLYLAGGGIIAHPDGPGTGVRSLREAWEAAVAGIAPDRYAEERPAAGPARGAAPLRRAGSGDMRGAVPPIAFFGDDFTGAADAMECLAAAGMRTKNDGSHEVQSTTLGFANCYAHPLE